LVAGGAVSIAFRSDEEAVGDEFDDKEFPSSTNGDFKEELESSSTRVVDFVCGGIFYLLLCTLCNATSEGATL
jgi:hypothetical protein